ncbi:hypothetical protein ACJMK2_017860 [Sinanodonta woodiana]|uniref:Uncharacterized protein n=3 Tax=Sinanodonta woodiana TaxID=1069815 RepID=A0ABD3UD32_SINWO
MTSWHARVRASDDKRSSVERRPSEEKRSSVDRTSFAAPTASGFGDDDESFNILIRRKTEKSETNRQVSEIMAPDFGKATFSKSTKAFDEIQTFQDEDEKRSSSISIDENQNPEHDDNSDRSTERSTEHSDEQSVSSVESFEASTGNWIKFAQTRFQVKSAFSYACSPLQQPLLPKTEKADILASLAAWVTILRIMGDLPEVDYGESFAVAGQLPPVVQRVKSNYHKKYSKKDIDDAYKAYTEMFKDPSAIDKNVPFLPDNRESMLEKVQFICALGIYRTDLRDELYCQVCKQLTNNPSKNSTVRGWVLLQMFAGSFVPSARFCPFFLQFLKDGLVEYAQRVERLLRRTFITGTRGQPPSWLEFQAAKNGKPILIPVIIMDGKRFLLETDSSSTVNELCSQLADKVALKERSGFSIYVSLNHRVACIGHGNHRVMDAVAECEQQTKSMGMRESSSNWRMYFRKEFFTPWFDPSDDEITTDLVYQQIMRGISVGEYKCDKEEVLVMMAAQRYYIEFSTNLEKTKIESFVKAWLPKKSQSEKEVSYWVEQLKSALEKDFVKEKPKIQSLKSDIVTFAMNKWYTMFSRFYDVSKLIGPDLSWNKVIVGVNCKGVHVLDDSESVKMHFSFVEISKVSKGRYLVTITTVQGDDYHMTSPHADDLFTLVTSFQMGLRRRSRFALVVQDASHFESAIGFGAAKGDLVKLDKPFEEYVEADVYQGTCMRTGKHGSLPKDVIYILPTADEPQANVLGMLAVQLRKEFPPVPMNIRFSLEEHTLQNYAKNNFRQSSDNKVTKLLSKASFKKEKKDPLWKFSKEPLKKPLLKRTVQREDLRGKVEVDASTRIVDIKKEVIEQLKLKGGDEYGLFFGLRDKVINANDREFVFDNIIHVQRYYVKNPESAASSVTNGSARDTIPAPPVLIFMKKLWTNATPGVEKIADVKFHFPQEQQNFLRGYHKISEQRIAEIACLLFRAKYGEEKQPLDHVVNVLPFLIPRTVVEKKTPDEWKKELQSHLEKVHFPNKDDGKVAFLKEMSKLDTYGSVFFEVKQRGSKNIPKTLTVAVNINGVFLIDPSTKSVLTTYGYDKIPNWAFDEHSFTLVVGENQNLTKIHFETNVSEGPNAMILAPSIVK